MQRIRTKENKANFTKKTLEIVTVPDGTTFTAKVDYKFTRTLKILLMRRTMSLRPKKYIPNFLFHLVMLHSLPHKFLCYFLAKTGESLQ